MRTVLFLHIPKTAGTSFLLALQNVFGDRHVHRLEVVDDTVPAQLDALLASPQEDVACITGHLPFHLLLPHLQQLAVFTVLRHPLDRVASLFRFLRDRTQDRDRLGLRPDFAFEDLLESRHPELFSQVHDGMVRLLSGAPELLNPNENAFWSRPVPIEYLERALANAQLIDYGTAEDMPLTLDLARILWRVPYRLPAYRENTTSRDETRDTVAALQKIAACNTLDLALYHRCKELLVRKYATTLARQDGTTYNPRTIFFPPPEGDVNIGNVPGRSGFHEFERIGIAWLHEGMPAEINFVATGGLRRFRLNFHVLHDDYPIEDTTLALNGSKLNFDLEPGQPKWYAATTTAFSPREGLNRLEIMSPHFLPVASVDPDSLDTRKLGLAISRISLREG